MNEDEKLNEIADVTRGFREIDERAEPSKSGSHLLLGVLFFLSSFAAKKRFTFYMKKLDTFVTIIFITTRFNETWVNLVLLSKLNKIYYFLKMFLIV